MYIKNSLYTITKEQQSIVNSCEHRLTYHAMAPYSWINDPNGFIYFKGEFHLFFQFNPKNPVWEHIHWGHYKSDNMIQWEYMPMALYPDQAYDKDGCFSGGAIIKDKKLYLVYTGNALDDNGMIKQTQCIATSLDGVNFEKYKRNPFLVTPPKGASKTNFRDPWVWQKEDVYYMVVGSSCEKNEMGQVILYRSDDLIDWEYINTIKDEKNRFGYMWECPSVFGLGGKDILMFCPQGLARDGELFNNKYQSGYVYGHLDCEKGTFDYSDFCELDRGFDFYAPQTTLDAYGRRIMIAWMDMWESQMPTKKNHWAGAMTLPRELKFENNRLKYFPIKEIENFRKNKVELENVYIQDKENLKAIEGTAFELIIEVKIGDIASDSFSLALRASEDEEEKTLLIYSKVEHKLSINRNDSGIGPKGIRDITLDRGDTHLKLRIFVDHSSVEVFVNDGEYVMSARIYPKATSRYNYLYGSACIKKIMKWDIR